MHWPWTSLATVAIALGLSGFSACQKLPSSQEQRDFSAEDERVKNPSKIPDEVMAILRTDERVKDAAEDENIPLDKVPTAWFSASRIRLGGDEATGLIVEAVGPLRGANVTMFWVFIKQNQTFKLALMLPTHDLIVKSTRSHGYKDLESMAATAIEVSTVRFKFDGEVYKEYSSKTEGMK